MPRNKLSKRQLEQIRLQQKIKRQRANCDESLSPSSGARLGAEQRGRIITRHSKHLLVEDSDGNLVRCVSRKNIGFPVTGDHIVWQSTEVGKGVAVAIEPRTSYLQRQTNNGQMKAIAANISQMFIVVSPTPKFNEEMIDRYLVAAEIANINPIILHNKSDLFDDQGISQARSTLRQYAEIGYDVKFVSALSRNNIQSIGDAMTNQISIFVGQSGVGKSSLINAILPDKDILVGELSSSSGQGMHTTTAITLYHLAEGGDLIDSPGVWEFGLGELTTGNLEYCFREFRPFLGQCKFSNCSHITEPGCAIREAISTGEISHRRFSSFLDIRKNHT